MQEIVCYLIIDTLDYEVTSSFAFTCSILTVEEDLKTLLEIDALSRNACNSLHTVLSSVCHLYVINISPLMYLRRKNRIDEAIGLNMISEMHHFNADP